jgi:hypothetical protein
LTWEVHIAVAPRPAFLRRVRLLAASLRRFGGIDPVRVVGLVQRECEPYDLAAALPWSEPEGIEWRWIDPDLLERYGPHVVSLERFLGPLEASHVLMLDADTLCVGPLDELAEHARDAFAAVVAFQSPLIGSQRYRDGRDRPPERFWPELFASAGLGAPDLACEHPLWGIVDEHPGRRLCPPYFNNGVMAGPVEVVRAIGDVLFAELDAVDAVVESFFRSQLAITLAICRSGAPWRALPLRFNFVNSAELWERFPVEAAAARIVHFLYTEELHRDRDFEDGDALRALLARDDLVPVNALVRDRIAAVVPDLAGVA